MIQPIKRLLPWYDNFLKFCVIILILIVHITIASRFLITNDEAYYIAFARSLQLSYVDSPPFVSYLTWIPTYFKISVPIILRSSVIFLHFLSTMLMILVVKNNCNTNKKSKMMFTTFLLAYICPIFGFYGILILPDSGLIFALSLMIYSADQIYKKQSISWLNTSILGIGLGIGLLSKYHIIPLGGGILLGLLVYLLPHYRHKWHQLLIKGLSIIIISVIISAPMWLWNYCYSFASFKFQLQHGFNHGNWSMTSLIIFICSSLLCITPWFSYYFMKYGLCRKPRLYIVLPFITLFLILLSSSLRKNVLGHWIAPAFWILLPYFAINLEVYGTKISKKILLVFCIITYSLLLMITLPLSLPGGMNNIKFLAQKITPDLSNLSDLLLWMDIKDILYNSSQFSKALQELHTTNSIQKCNDFHELIGTTDWMFTSQFEYLQLFDQLSLDKQVSYKVLNINIEHANFYLWRDDLSQFAHCPILIVTNRHLPEYIKDIIQVTDQSTIDQIANYKDLKINLIAGIFKDKDDIQKAQNLVLQSGHY